MMPRAEDPGRIKLAIAGGGVAAVEAALAVRDLAKDRVEVEIWAPRAEFVYRPFAVGAPYQAADVLRYDLTALADACGATFRLGGIVSVDTEARRAMARDGAEIPYDCLLLAPGARMLWAVPGAVTFWGVADEGGVGGIVRRLRAGQLRNVAFTMPVGNTWALPLYELALLSRAVLSRSGIEDARLTVVTPEEAPLQLFGRAVGEQMRKLLAERGIELIAGVHPVSFHDGRLEVAPGGTIETEAAISLPRLEGRRIDGVPYDDDGFVRVDEHCAVVGLEDVYAAGDVTDFPVKQGGIASDVAATAIAAAAGAEVELVRFKPVLRAVLWTGDEPRYLNGHLTGGHGDLARLDETPPWGAEIGKIVSRYLGPFLAELSAVDHRRLVARAATPG
jgi:sulfide:quinone oxidoreductase